MDYSTFIPDSTQALAISACINTDNTPRQRIVAVTGRAGTGKTLIMRQVYDVLTSAGYSVVLCAPTGKAAKRIREATGLPAHTIHMLLEYTSPGDIDPKTGKHTRDSIPRRWKQNPLTYDYVLADEYAMVNSELHRNLVDALPNGGKLRVFGDVNQLPPIEENKRLLDEPSAFQMLLSKFTGITLNVNHRQDDNSGIAVAGDHLLIGRMPRRADDFIVQFTEQPVNTLRDHVVDAEADYRSPDNQIITTMYKTWVGTYKLNAFLQTLLSDAHAKSIMLPRWPHSKDFPVQVRVGDKVINTQNQYDLGCFNGETGIVMDITEYDEIIIDFGDQVVTFPPLIVVDTEDGPIERDPRKSLDLAYVLTTHKCQGSEYDHVVYILNKSTAWMQCRPNIYTAVTRGRKKVTVITDQLSLSRSVQRKEQMRRV